MAKNFHQDGDVLDLIAPAGGVVSGGAYRIGTINCVALVTAAEGEVFAAKTTGVWRLPAAAGLTAGAGVALTDGELVAVGSGALFGKLVGATVDGEALCRLSN